MENIESIGVKKGYFGVTNAKTDSQVQSLKNEEISLASI